MGRIHWAIGDGLGLWPVTKKKRRLQHCIFSLILGIRDEATAGKDIDSHWIPEGGGPKTTTLQYVYH